jgi:hypothetical protein
MWFAESESSADGTVAGHSLVACGLISGVIYRHGRRRMYVGENAQKRRRPRVEGTGMRRDYMEDKERLGRRHGLLLLPRYSHSPASMGIAMAKRKQLLPGV